MKLNPTREKPKKPRAFPRLDPPAGRNGSIGRRICKCECGGIVRGIKGFDRLWTWCEACTPVVTFKLTEKQSSRPR